MDNTSVIAEFKQADAILNGHFILSSGLHSDTYIQCARALMNPSRADRLCSALATKLRSQLKDTTIDMVVAPAMGGVVVGYEMARQLQLDGIFCERVNGSFALRRGFAIPEGAHVLVVEDVVTTGKSSRECFECIRAHGGVVVAEACLINRSGTESPVGDDVPLVSLLDLEVATFSADEVPEHLQTIEAIKPGSRWLI